MSDSIKKVTETLDEAIKLYEQFFGTPESGILEEYIQEHNIMTLASLIQAQKKIDTKESQILKSVKCSKCEEIYKIPYLHDSFSCSSCGETTKIAPCV